MKGLTYSELASESAEFLPRREALALVALNINVAPVTGVNLGMALNAASSHANAAVTMSQHLGVWQR